MNDNEHSQRGWKKLKEVDGEAGARVIVCLMDIAPEFARLLAFPFAERERADR